MKALFNRRLLYALATVALAGGLIAVWTLGRTALRPVALYSGWLLLALLLRTRLLR